MKKNIYIFIFTIVILVILAISFLYFSTFNNEADKNNIYYIFSTSAQTLAALVGFVLTAYIFTYQNLRSIKEEDETLTEIIDITIEKYYDYIFLLSSYTAVVLIADILILQLNMIETWPFKSAVLVFIAMTNVFGIIFAFAIALFIMRPFKEKKWARSILNDNEEKEGNEKVTKEMTQADNDIPAEITVGNASKDMVDTMKFIEKFIELEGIIRLYTDKKFKFNERTPLRKRLDYLGATNKLSPGVIEELLIVIKYRNLAVHGHSTIIEWKVYDTLIKLLDEVKNNLQ